MIYIESDCVLYAGHNSTSVAEVVLGFVYSFSCHGLFVRSYLVLSVRLPVTDCLLRSYLVLTFRLIFKISCYGLVVYIDNWLKDYAYKHSILLCILFVIKVYIALHDVTFEQEIELTSTM